MEKIKNTSKIEAMKFIKRLGFTLAEVLIVMGIVGIVAEMTVPALVQDYQKKYYTTNLKKAYTEFNQALKQMSQDNGCFDNLKCTGLFASDKTTMNLGDEISKYFNISKNCKNNPYANTWNGLPGGCLHASQIGYNYDNSGSRTGVGGYSFVTQDGILYIVVNSSNGCASSGYNDGMAQYCGLATIDVNGPYNGPNNYGRDVFQFTISNGRGALLYPYGGRRNTWWRNEWDANNPHLPRYCYPGNPAGQYCAGRIMDEDWEMNY